MGILDTPGYTRVQANARYGPRRTYAPGAVGSVGPFAPATMLIDADGTTQAVGYDAVDGLLILARPTTLHTSNDNGATRSTNKGVPLSGQTNPGNRIGRIIRFGGLWVCLITDQTNNCAAIYTSPAPGHTGTCTWTERQRFTTGSDGSFSTCIDTDGTTIVAGEYGDPMIASVRSPHTWRSTDGVTWTSTDIGVPAANNRHIHAIHADYSQLGRFWMSNGDGPSPCLFYSDNGGAAWTGVAAIDSSRQVVQISSDATNLYLAADTTVADLPCDLWVLDKVTLTNLRAGHSDAGHRRLAVPNPGKYATGQVTSGSPLLRDFAHAAFANGAHKGARIDMAGVPAGTTVLSVDSVTQITMSANATSTQTDVKYQLQGVNEKWWSASFFGCVDPATGIYYFTTPGDGSGDGNIVRGIFYIPYVGGPVCLLDKVLTAPRAIFVANGWLYCGNLRRPTLTFA